MQIVLLKYLFSKAATTNIPHWVPFSRFPKRIFPIERQAMKDCLAAITRRRLWNTSSARDPEVPYTALNIYMLTLRTHYCVVVHGSGYLSGNLILKHSRVLGKWPQWPLLWTCCSFFHLWSSLAVYFLVAVCWGTLLSQQMWFYGFCDCLFIWRSQGEIKAGRQILISTDWAFIVIAILFVMYISFLVD